MDISFLIVGTAKGNKEDFEKLYLEKKDMVFAFSLSVLHDRVLAKDMLIETFRRINEQAYLYEPDFSADFWILNIVRNLCYNALRDGELMTLMQSERKDGIPPLLMQAVWNLKSDMGQLIVLHALSSAKSTDIAMLLWYYNKEEKKEYRHALKELSKHSKVPVKKIKNKIVQETEECTPEVWDLLFGSSDTRLSQISAEAPDGPLTPETESDTQKKPFKNTAKFKILIGITSVILTAAIVFLIIFLVKRNNDETPVSVQIGNICAMTEVNGVLYYQDHTHNNMLYSYDLVSKKTKKISTDSIRELLTDGEYLFYRIETENKIYRINTDGTNKIQVAPNLGTTIALDGDWLYYSTADGIDRVRKDGTDNETFLVIENKTNFRYDMKIYDDQVYFSCGAGGGLFRVDKENTTNPLFPLYFSEVYTFSIEDGYLYFDEKEPDGKIFLYRINVETGVLYNTTDKILSTGANYIKNGIVYFDGYSAAGSMDLPVEQGIYSINADGSDPKKLFDGRASDIYVSDNYIYCYYPTGGGHLTAYPLENPQKSIKIY